MTALALFGVLLVGSTLTAVECPPTTLSADALRAHIEREIPESVEITARCSDAQTVVITWRGQRSAISLVDVDASMRARTVALLTSEWLRAQPRALPTEGQAPDPPPPSPPLVEPESRTESRGPWRLILGVDLALADSDLNVGPFVDVRLGFGTLALLAGAGAYIEPEGSGSVDLKVGLRLGAQFELALTDHLALDLGVITMGGHETGGGSDWFVWAGPRVGLRPRLSSTLDLQLSVSLMLDRRAHVAFGTGLALRFDL